MDPSSCCCATCGGGGNASVLLRLTCVLAPAGSSPEVPNSVADKMIGRAFLHAICLLFSMPGQLSTLPAHNLNGCMQCLGPHVIGGNRGPLQSTCREQALLVLCFPTIRVCQCNMFGVGVSFLCDAFTRSWVCALRSLQSRLGQVAAFVWRTFVFGSVAEVTTQRCSIFRVPPG